MDVNLNNKSMEEYINKLRLFSKQLLSEGKEYIAYFLEKLISSENKTVELLDFIYKSADDLTMDLVIIFNKLLEHGAELEWFIVSSYIEEESGNIILYQDIIQKCVENKIEIELIRNQIYEICDVEELERFVNALLSRNTKESDEDSLKEDKSQKLHLEIKALTNELELCHNELVSERLNLDKCSKELEYFQTQHKRCELKISILERKIIQIEESNVQLQNVNDFLEDKKGKLELDYIQLQEEKANLKQKLEDIREEYELKIQEKDMRLDELSLTLSEYKQQISMLEERVLVTRTTPVYREETIMDYEEPDIPGIDDVIPPDIFNAVSPQMFTNVSDDISSANAEETDDEEDFEIGTDIFRNAIEIKDNRKKAVEHTNVFVRVFQWYQKEKFMKKSEQEQKNIIFIEMMKKNFSIELVETIKKTMVSNSSVSKFDLYILILRNAREEIIKLCKGQA